VWRFQNVNTVFLSFLQRVLFKLGITTIFVVMLAITTAASLGRGLQYVSVIWLLIALWLFGLALVCRRPFIILSEWGESLLFSLMAACAHFL
jgi:hypothetical protein